MVVDSRTSGLRFADGLPRSADRTEAPRRREVEPGEKERFHKMANSAIPRVIQRRRRSNPGSGVVIYPAFTSGTVSCQRSCRLLVRCRGLDQRLASSGGAEE